jgi:hypothetical protein
MTTVFRRTEVMDHQSSENIDVDWGKPIYIMEVLGCLSVSGVNIDIPSVDGIIFD